MTMCLAIPGKIVSINDDIAEIDFGGVMKKANVSMVDARFMFGCSAHRVH